VVGEKSPHFPNQTELKNIRQQPFGIQESLGIKWKTQYRKAGPQEKGAHNR